MSDKPLKELGEKIQSQRESMGLSLKDIADKTKISLSALQALESGDDSHLPAPVFVKGFLRSYALEIGLKPEDLISEYNFQNPETDKPVAVPVTARKNLEDRSWLWLVIPVFILLLVAGTFAYLYLPGYLNSTGQTETSLPSAQETITGTETQTAPELSGTILQEPSTDKVETVAGGPTTTETIAPPSTASVPVMEESTPAPSSPLEESTTVAGQGTDSTSDLPGSSVSAVTDVESPGQGHELTMNFSADTWVQIAVDDKELQHGLFKPGMSKTWHADKSFSLRIGNAGGVNLIFDGKRLGSLGGDGQVVALELPEKTKP